MSDTDAIEKSLCPDRPKTFSTLEDYLWSALHETKAELAASRGKEERLQSLVEQARMLLLDAKAQIGALEARARAAEAGIQELRRLHDAPLEPNIDVRAEMRETRPTRGFFVNSIPARIRETLLSARH